MGVRRAVQMALEESARADSTFPGSLVYTLGPLIHNARVLEILRERGITCLIESGIPGAPENSTVIIRAHGISPVVEETLLRQGLRIVDATCPHVKLSQEQAASFAEKGYKVFLAGGAGHGEMAGIRGYVENALTLKEDKDQSCFPSCFIVGNPAEAEAAASELFCREPRAKTVLIGQTTIRVEEYFSISEQIQRYFPSLEIVDSICCATKDRQEALRQLCGITDAVIIAGGNESANTQRLYSLACELGKPAWLVETVSDLPAEIDNYQTVGLSAGASTPDELIDEIEEALNNSPHLCKF